MISNATVPSLRLWVSASNPELDFFRLWYSFHSPRESGNFFCALGLCLGMVWGGLINVNLIPSRARIRAHWQEFSCFCCHKCHTFLTKLLWICLLSRFYNIFFVYLPLKVRIMKNVAERKWADYPENKLPSFLFHRRDVLVKTTCCFVENDVLF